MRLFVAADLPDGVRDSIARALRRLRRELPGARWVRPEGVHLTLKFLGEQPPELVERLSAIAAPALAALPPATVGLRGGGFFPGPGRPRVAWLGGAAGGLERWAAAVDGAAEELGIERERRPFSLHLTLARLQRPWPPAAVERFLALVGELDIEPFTAREAVLFQSDLRPGGAVYTALRRWPTKEV